MSDNKKKGRRKGAGAPKPEPSQPESVKSEPRNFEATVPVKAPETAPEKAEPAKPAATKPAPPTGKGKKLLNLIENIVLVFGFGVMLGSIFFVNEFRPIVAGSVDVIVAPIIATMPFYIVVLAIAAIVTVVSTFIQKYTMDWELMRSVTQKNQILSKEMREAQLAGNKAKVKKLQEEQMAGLQDQQKMSMMQIKPMGFLMIISVPLFFWAYWYLSQHPDLTMVFPFAGTVTLMQGAFFIFPWWIVWSILCSFGISQVVRKAFNVGIAS
ncbi:MAG: EMC3/TMCO1 family protein [Methanocella sp.]